MTREVKTLFLIGLAALGLFASAMLGASLARGFWLPAYAFGCGLAVSLFTFAFTLFEVKPR